MPAGRRVSGLLSRGGSGGAQHFRRRDAELRSHVLRRSQPVVVTCATATRTFSSRSLNLLPAAARTQDSFSSVAAAVRFGRAACNRSYRTRGSR